MYEECSLLSKGLQHNLSDYGKDMLIREVVNAEAVSKQIKTRKFRMIYGLSLIHI